MGQRGNLRALAGICETSSSSRATASKQTRQNVVMATVEY